MKQVKIVIEKHPDGYVAYPIGLTGVIVGQGDTYDEALADVKSAIDCYVEVFGKEMFDDTNWHLEEVQRRVASQYDLPRSSWVCQGFCVRAEIKQACGLQTPRLKDSLQIVENIHR